jgi:hypothetical protein
MRALLSVLVLYSVISTSCASDKNSEPANSEVASTPLATTTQDEGTRAADILLTINDFPTGWSEESQPDEENAFDRCDPDTAPGNLGEAETGDFSDGSDFTLTHSVAIFESNAQVDFAIDRAEGVAQCFVDVIESGAADNENAEFTGATLSRLSFPVKGDRTEAYRLKFHAQAKDQSGFGSGGDVFFDLVFMRVGRVGIAIYAFDIFSPPEPDVWEQYVDIAVMRARTVD